MLCENLNLKTSWITFSDHLRKTLFDLKNSNEFADVTLVCDDRRQFKAHKVILSACSSVFKSILNELPQTNSAIFLSGVNHQVIESILEFVYLGETTFDQSRINEFISVSTNLKIKNIVEDLETSKTIRTDDLEENFNYSKDTDLANVQAPNSNTDNSENHVMDETLREESQLHKHEKIIIDHAPEISSNEKVTKVICKSNPKTSLENNGIISVVENHCIAKNEEYAPKISNNEKVTKVLSESNPEASLENSKINSLIENQYIAKNEERPFHCSQCESKYKSKKTLLAHIKSLHEGIKFPCVQCDKQFSHQGGLLAHFQSIHQGVTYSCKQCGQKFARQSSVTKHMKIHEGVRFSCSQCDFQATFKYNLEIHIKTKHEDLKYTCNQCNQHYSHPSALKYHTDSYHNEEEYTCNLCDYETTHLRLLTIHIQSRHENVKYGCNQCGQQFVSQGGLQNHVESKHEGVKHSCNQCDYRASHRSSLTRHIQSQH